jgi:hypothetical protein
MNTPEQKYGLGNDGWVQHSSVPPKNIALLELAHKNVPRRFDHFHNIIPKFDIIKQGQLRQ